MLLGGPQMIGAASWEQIIFVVGSIIAAVTYTWRLNAFVNSRLQAMERQLLEYQLYVANHYVGNASLRDFKSEILERFTRLEDTITHELRKRPD